MDEFRRHRILRRFCYAYTGLAVLVFAAFMAYAFPWWQASNHPVIFSLSAPPETRLELGFAEEAYLPLVPLGEETAPHRLWATELPPRPEYALSLRFPEGTPEPLVLASAKYLTLSPERKETPLSLGLLQAAEAPGVTVSPSAGGWSIKAEPGAVLPLPGTVEPPGLAHWIADLLAACLTFAMVAGVVLMLLVTALRVPERLGASRLPLPSVEWGFLLACLAAGSIAHLYLVGNSLPDYWPADSTSYTAKAVSLAEAFTYDSGTHEYELNRMPGFPLFMAAVFILAGWDLHAVVLAQGGLFCLAVLVLAVSLRRFLGGRLAGLAALAALLSPPAVWASRQIATESTFASMWMLALAGLVVAWQREGWARYAGWLAFGLCGTAAVAIRPNGVLLFALPGFYFTATLWWAVSENGLRFWRMPLLWRAALQVALPGLLLVAFLAAWSARNYLSRGYPKPTDLTEVVWANAPFFAGIFDIRAAADPAEYRWFVNERSTSGYWFHGWSVRRYRFRVITNEYQDIQDSSIARLEAELAAFNTASRHWIPPQAWLAGYGRVAAWGLWLPDIAAYSADPIVQNYSVLTDFRNQRYEQQVRRNLAWSTRNLEREIRLVDREPDPWIDRYNAVLVPAYPWVYRVLLALALASWLVALRKRRYLAAVLAAPFLLNVLLNIYFLYIVGRYVQVLDASLWFAACAGLACLFADDRQEPTSVRDRRVFN